jgi:hypothetical protein
MASIVRYSEDYLFRVQSRKRASFAGKHGQSRGRRNGNLFLPLSSVSQQAGRERGRHEVGGELSTISVSKRNDTVHKR